MEEVGRQVVLKMIGLCRDDRNNLFSVAGSNGLKFQKHIRETFSAGKDNE